MGLEYLKYLSEPKSKLKLPRVTTGLDKSLNQSSQGGLENIDYMSNNGPPGNCCKVLNEHTIRHVLVGQNGWSTKGIVKSNFVTSYLIFRASIPTVSWFTRGTKE